MTTWFVAPHGTDQNAGTSESPWSLPWAAAGAGGQIGAGHTVRLVPGQYEVGPMLTVTVSGTQHQPIVFAGDDERTTIVNGGVSVNGNHVWLVRWRSAWYRDTVRTTNVAGSSPLDVPRANPGVGLVLGQGVRLVQCIHNDLAGGIFSGGNALGFTADENIFYNNGWSGPDRGHGHGFYSQNNGVTRHRIRANIVFCQYSSGIKLAGSSTAELFNFDVIDNCVFSNGLPAAPRTGSMENNINHDGGRVNKGGSVIDDNWFMHPHSPQSTSFDIGDNFTGALPMTMTRNKIQGRVFIADWPAGTSFTDNVVSDFPALSNILQPIGLIRVKNTPDYTINRNRYATRESASPFARSFILSATGKNWTQWRDETSYDDDSVFVDGAFTGVIVDTIPSRYTIGRGHIYVWNHDNAAEVSVDLGDIVPLGMPYQVHHVFDYVTGSSPVAQGIANGTRVVLPMVAKQPPTPFGGNPLPTMDNTFGVFVVTPRTAGFTTTARGTLG